MTGTCRFCGQMRELNARSQADADEKASRSCDCAASGDYARKMATQEAVEEICESYDITDAQVTLLQAVALSVDDGILDKAGLTLAGLKVTVGSKANGNTYLRIVQSEEENREITRNGLK